MDSIFNNLVELARKEEFPTVNVSFKVMDRIKKQKFVEYSSSIKPMKIVAGISAVAASIIIIFTVYSYKKNYDPVSQFLYNEISWVQN